MSRGFYQAKIACSRHVQSKLRVVRWNQDFSETVCALGHTCNSHWISSNILAWLAHSHHSNPIGSSGKITLLGAINPCLTQRLAHWPSRGHCLCDVTKAKVANVFKDGTVSPRFMLYCRYVSPKRSGCLKLQMNTCPGQRFYFFRLPQVLWPLTSQMSWRDAFWNTTELPLQ